MELYREYPAWLIFLRRTYAVAAGVLALPFTLFWKDRARFYSYLHRVWSKTSDKPVWMDQAEKATGDFYLLLSFEYIENRQRKRWRFFVSGRCSEEYLDIVIPIETYIHEIYINIFLIVLI